MRTLARPLLILALQLLLLAMMMAFPRPIWTDEVLQFAWGAFSDTPRTIRWIFWSVGARMNHGQTGAYMIVNHLALKYFGASYFALRFPSYLSYFFSLVAGYAILGRMGASTLVRLLGMLGLAFCLLNITHGSEARPYVVLEATVLGFLWAWQRYLAGERYSRAGLFGIAALGVLFHPFFVAYAGCLVVGSLLLQPEARRFVACELRSPRRLAVIAGGKLALLALFLLIGKWSWFHSIHKVFGKDPYEYIGHDKSVARFMLGTFFYPWSLYLVPLLGVLFAVLVWQRKRCGLQGIWAQVLLLGGTTALTQFVITRSVIRSEYWILQRQWIAGNALAVLVAALLVEMVLRIAIGRIPRKLLLGAEALLWGVGVAGAVVSIQASVRQGMRPIVPLEESEAYLARVQAQSVISMGDLERLAHQNLLRGGPVWPIFNLVYFMNPNDVGGPPPP